MSNPIIYGQNELSDYKRVEKEDLGSGTYGIVFKAMFKQNPNMIVAIKQLQYGMHDQGFPSTSIRQISILRKLKSTNIVRLLDVIFEQKKIYLVFQFLDRDLKIHIDRMRESKEFMHPQVVRKLIFQLISGIAEIHEQRVIHRDVKPANILIDNEFNLKIADFGLARTYSIPMRPYSNGVVTQWYRAPQILLGSPQYSTPIDMWSIGCIFAEMVILKPLFQGNSDIDQIFRIFRCLGTPTEEVWPGVSVLPLFKKITPSWPASQIQKSVKNINLDENGLHLLKSLLIYDPSKRITASAALKHPYFNELAESIN